MQQIAGGCYAGLEPDSRSEGRPMRGRKLRPCNVTPDDFTVLQQIARRTSLPFFQVQRARILLALAQGETVQTLAERLQCDRTTIWRLCRRYERSGLAGLLEPPQRSGCPQRISPPAAGAHHPVDLP
jgi:hypothetical protein